MSEFNVLTENDKADNNTLVCVSDIVKQYVSGDETLNILKGISFNIRRGVSVAISGQSGSGKSTLLNILGGIEKADGGRVIVGGTDISGLPEKNLSLYRSRQVGFIFQFHYLLKDFTALENVMLPAYIAGVSKKAAMDKARSLLADVKMEDRIKHYPSQLSGGERQRVAVARSMINDPDMILADEPTGNLDPDNSSAVAELLYAGAEKRGKTLIVVTHDETVASRASMRFILENGLVRVTKYREPDEDIKRRPDGYTTD
jgi:lipoprotein-releasing system ATP-binding protein